MKTILATFFLAVCTQLAGADPFLDLRDALEIASEAVKDDPGFKGTFPISARITEPSNNKERYDGQIYVNLWRIDFSTFYPPPPRTPTYVEVTHDKKVFIRK
jgi:hypothetical protein